MMTANYALGSLDERVVRLETGRNVTSYGQPKQTVDQKRFQRLKQSNLSMKTATTANSVCHYSPHVNWYEKIVYKQGSQCDIFKPKRAVLTIPPQKYIAPTLRIVGTVRERLYNKEGSHYVFSPFFKTNVFDLLCT